MSVQTGHVPSHHGASMVANAAIATPKRPNSKIPATVNERASSEGVSGGGGGGSSGGNEEWPKWAWSIGIKGKLNTQIYKDNKVPSFFLFHGIHYTTPQLKKGCVHRFTASKWQEMLL